MDVEIPAPVREAAAGLGAGVPYTLKVLAGQLAEDPDMGEPSSLPGILDVRIGGVTFEDCPALVVGYIREPDRIEVRYVTGTQHETPADNDPDLGRDRHTADEEVVGREISDAWARITGNHRGPRGRSRCACPCRTTGIVAVDRWGRRSRRGWLSARQYGPHAVRGGGGLLPAAAASPCRS
ncbi:hypothetical protein Slala03_21410 [Streptomyces lavendulae subsp. lavendulae]|nr:hypothetical protein Slala03_21410 [Streptomyces lavendulae subsp. lavendulae]